MARRSLQASDLGIKKAQKAFKTKAWTQEYLANEVGIETRQPIWKFFSGKPIERHIFMEICFRLDLDWQEIADLPSEVPTLKAQDQDNSRDIDRLVQMVRSRRSSKIQAQCGTIRLLDIAQLIELKDIYVNINIQEANPRQNWVEVSNLQNFSPEEFVSVDLSQIFQERVPALKAVATYSKLMILGKPGCGKTTLLQHIAMQCNQGELLPDRVPIFIRLKNFAEDATEASDFSLLNYIRQEFCKNNISAYQFETLLHHGKVLILLDGLDEVQEEERGEVLKQIRKLSEEYYNNHLIVTCRIATQQYRFEGFTDIEIADFDSSQIEAFAQKWFVIVGKNSREQGLAKAAQFMQKLQLSENWLIRELAKTPILLNLVCCVFHAKSDFPTKRADLYKQGLEILLVRWDEARGIKRDEIYRQLSLPQKIKLLSQIATITFEQGHYFFAQSQIQQYIADYLSTLPNAQTDPEVLQLNSEAVLKSIEAQHGLLVERARGIYSFSHLTFQEYLTARNFVVNSDSHSLEKNLDQLVSHMTEPRWREVFLLVAGMLENVDALIQSMHQYSDGLLAGDQKLQQFLIWLHLKSLSVQAPYKSAAIRAFYLTLVLPRELSWARDLSLALAIDPRLAGNLAPDLALDLALNRALSLSLVLPCDPSWERVLALSFALPLELAFGYGTGLHSETKLSPLGESLQHLKEQLPASEQGSDRLKEWWSANGQTWTEKLKFLILRYRNINYQWQFSNQQQEVLKQYYAAKQLLLDCLNSGCEVSSNLREWIEETLLLPIVEIGSFS